MQNSNRLLRKRAAAALVPAAAACLLALSVIGCGGDEPTDTGNDPIIVPTSYTFKSRFDASKSGVNYNDAVVQNLLIGDLQERINALGEAGATASIVAEVRALYDHKDADNLQTGTLTGTLPPLERRYNLIATGQSLKAKVSPAQLMSYGKSTDQMLQELFQTLSTNAADPTRLGTPMAYTTDDGIDISSFAGTLLMGAVSYYQAMTTHLNGVENKNNTANNGNTSAPATEMERAWDAAFGYFGAARDYAHYSDAALAGNVNDYVFDTDVDGKINFSSEYNFPAARYAGMRDNGRSTNFTKTIFDAFLAGRANIAGQGTSAAIVEQRKIVRETWERIMAATLIHYINQMRRDIEQLTEDSKPENSAAMNRNWGAMKALALTLQFNPAKKISDEDLQVVHSYLENMPQYYPQGTPEYSAYHSRLGLARTIIQESYGFNGTDVTNW